MTDYAIVLYDRSFLVTPVQPQEKNDWASAAQRICAERFTDLNPGEHYILMPLLGQPLRWDEHRIQLFGLRYLT